MASSVVMIIVLGVWAGVGALMLLEALRRHVVCGRLDHDLRRDIDSEGWKLS